MKKTAFALLILAACRQEPTGTTSPAANVIANQAGEPNESAEGNEARQDASLRSAEIGPLTLRYDPAKLVQTDAEIGIPPDWRNEIPGMKLIARDRLELMDTAECMYGQRGAATLCEAEKEAGLAFALVDTPYETLSARITDPAPSQVTVAGREGIVWEIGAEGEGAVYTLLPAGERTLLIVNQYRNSGNPDEAAIRQVMNSLSLDAD